MTTTPSPDPDNTEVPMKQTLRACSRFSSVLSCGSAVLSWGRDSPVSDDWEAVRSLTRNPQISRDEVACLDSMMSPGTSTTGISLALPCRMTVVVAATMARSTEQHWWPCTPGWC